ncbi:hypothetical protein JVT61DRAFT_15643 [Boletus reticuloceps]|uniref:Uncharacterized protein n=1 Tax=Boletus reticuloceps TaxID=495285 RepID=A0A8I2YC43_9AGAM|nr:hypothetical protein JVT61DRAFT_15643 [Boletus reticuloceps]
MDFHINYLLQLVGNKAELRHAVLMLQQTMKVMKAGRRIKMTVWHLECLKKMCLNDPEIVEAIDLVADCLEYRHELEE